MAESVSTVGLQAHTHAKASLVGFWWLLMDLLSITAALNLFLPREEIHGLHVPVCYFEVVAKCSLERWYTWRNFMLVWFFSSLFPLGLLFVWLWVFWCVWVRRSGFGGVEGVVYFSFLPWKEITSSSPLWLNKPSKSKRSWSWWSLTYTLGLNKPKVCFHIYF